MVEEAKFDVGPNLLWLRKARRLSQAELAARAGLSLGGYRRIERGQSVPRLRTLVALARALEVPPDALLHGLEMPAQVRFRALRKMNRRRSVLVDVARWLRDYADVEELVGERIDWRLRDLVERARRESMTPHELAREARAQMGVPEGDIIHDICGLLEDCGVKVGRVRVNAEGFFGLSVGPSDGGPAVVVNAHPRIPVERWIFTAAHELGHLLMHLDSFHVDEQREDKDEERAANEFASEFLMPPDVFERAWGAARGLPLVERVFKVKRLFRVSYRTVLYRLQGRYPDIWRDFQQFYLRAYGRTLRKTDEPFALDDWRSEPKRLEAEDFEEDRLARLVRQAYEAGAISLGRAAEILGLSSQEMRQRAAAWLD